MPAAAPHPMDHWDIETRVRRGAPGEGLVDFVVTNEGMGTLQPVTVSVEWKPGMEEGDVDRVALLLVSRSAKAFADACLVKAAAIPKD